MSTTYLPHILPSRHALHATAPALAPVVSDPTTQHAGPTHVSLDDLATAIARDGIEAHEPAVREVLSFAAILGFDCPATQVLADAHAPSIVRERAFGIVASALERPPQPDRIHLS